MKRKITCLLLSLLLLLGAAIPVLAAETSGAQLLHVTDTAGILSEDEDYQLESHAEEVSQRYDFGIYVVTIPDYNDFNSEGVFETAYGLYHEYTLGVGEDRNGAMLLLSMDNRKFATFFYGPKAEYTFDAYGQEKLEDYFLDEFHNDNWYAGLDGFVTGCEEFLAAAAAGEPVRKSHTTAVIIAIAASCVIAMIICLSLRGKMKSVRAAANADKYTSGELNLTQSRDEYTHTTETRTKIESESSGGESSSSSGGGGSGRSGSF